MMEKTSLGLLIGLIGIYITVILSIAGQTNSPFIHDTHENVIELSKNQTKILENTEQITELKQKIVDLTDKIDKLQNTIENFNKIEKNNP